MSEEEEVETIGKWAVVLAKGYGTSQKWKVTPPGSAFPDNWCKSKVRDGYYITSVGTFPLTCCIINVSVRSVFMLSIRFHKGFVCMVFFIFLTFSSHSHLTRSLLSIRLTGGRGGKHKKTQQWAVICTKGIMPGGAQSWRWTGWGDGFPNDWAQKKYDSGLRVTSVGCTGGRWCVVMSTPPQGCKVKQWWAWRDSWAHLFEW